MVSQRYKLKAKSKAKPKARSAPHGCASSCDCTANPMAKVPIAWFNICQASEETVMEAYAHCLSVANVPLDTRPDSRLSPVANLVEGARTGAIGFVFRTREMLARQIASPPVIDGVSRPWCTIHGDPLEQERVLTEA
ncbi:hypothetical protein GGI15_001729 [Coemansia interrupta]|uniref:Uncharacterized protein n=1 Tax=Coemansia interrupta TaxID=1126814 RepID=A0A9W8HNH0_9FUNG|nr:hypothetical protein GGI15_001729 [Coemansia interrupta]